MLRSEQEQHSAAKSRLAELESTSETSQAEKKQLEARIGQLEADLQAATQRCSALETAASSSEVGQST